MLQGIFKLVFQVEMHLKQVGWEEPVVQCKGNKRHVIKGLFAEKKTCYEMYICGAVVFWLPLYTFGMCMEFVP